MKRISQKTVAISVVDDGDLQIIHLSSDLEKYLVKNPICGPSDYTDLPGVEGNVTSSWRQFSPAGRRRVAPQVLSEETRRKREEAKLRRQLKMAGLQRKREELVLRRALKRKVQNQIKESGGSESSQEMENENDSNSDFEPSNIIISSPNKRRFDRNRIVLSKSSNAKKKLILAKDDISSRRSGASCKTDSNSKPDENIPDGSDDISDSLDSVKEDIGNDKFDLSTDEDKGNKKKGSENNLNYNSYQISKKSPLKAVLVKSSSTSNRSTSSKHPKNSYDHDETWSTDMDSDDYVPKPTRVRRRAQRINYAEERDEDDAEEDFHFNFKPVLSTKSGRKVIPATRKLEDAIVSASMTKTVKRKRKEAVVEAGSDSVSTVTDKTPISTGQTEPPTASSSDSLLPVSSFHEAQSVITDKLLNSQNDIVSRNNFILTSPSGSSTEEDLNSSKNYISKESGASPTEKSGKTVDINSQKSKVTETVTQTHTATDSLSGGAVDRIVTAMVTQKTEYDDHKQAAKPSVLPSSSIYPLPLHPEQQVKVSQEGIQAPPPSLQQLQPLSLSSPPPPPQQPLHHQQQQQQQSPTITTQQPPPPLISFLNDPSHILPPSNFLVNLAPVPLSSSSSSLPSSHDHFQHQTHYRHHLHHPAPPSQNASSNHSHIIPISTLHHKQDNSKFAAALMAAATGQPVTPTIIKTIFPPSSSSSTTSSSSLASPTQPHHTSHNSVQHPRILYQPRPPPMVSYPSAFVAPTMPLPSLPPNRLLIPIPNSFQSLLSMTTTSPSNKTPQPFALPSKPDQHIPPTHPNQNQNVSRPMNIYPPLGFPPTATNVCATKNPPVNHSDVTQKRLSSDKSTAVRPKKSPQTSQKHPASKPAMPKGHRPSLPDPYHHNSPSSATLSSLQNSKDHPSSAYSLSKGYDFLQANEHLATALRMGDTSNNTVMKRAQPPSREARVSSEHLMPLPPPAHNNNTPPKPAPRCKESSMRDVEDMLNNMTKIRQGKDVPAKSSTSNSQPSPSHTNSKAQSMMAVEAMLETIKAAHNKKLKEAASVSSQSDIDSTGNSNQRKSNEDSDSNSRNVRPKQNQQPPGKRGGSQSSQASKMPSHQPPAPNAHRAGEKTTQQFHGQAHANAGLPLPHDSPTSFYRQGFYDHHQQQSNRFESPATVSVNLSPMVSSHAQSSPRSIVPPPAHQNRQPALPPPQSTMATRHQSQRTFQELQSPNPRSSLALSPQQQQNPRFHHHQQHQQQANPRFQQQLQQMRSLQQEVTAQAARQPLPEQPGQPHPAGLNPYAQFNLRPTTTTHNPSGTPTHAHTQHQVENRPAPPLPHPRPPSNNLGISITPTPPTNKTPDKPSGNNSNTISSPNRLPESSSQSRENSSSPVDSKMSLVLQKSQQKQQRLENSVAQNSQTVSENIPAAGTGHNLFQPTSESLQNENPPTPADSKMSLIIQRHLQQRRSQANAEQPLQENQTDSDPSSSHRPLQSPSPERESSASPVDSKMSLILQRQSQEHSHLITKPIHPTSQGESDSPSQSPGPSPPSSLTLPSTTSMSQSSENIPSPIDSKISLHRQLLLRNTAGPAQPRQAHHNESKINLQSLSNSSTTSSSAIPERQASPVDSKMSLVLQKKGLLQSQPPDTPIVPQSNQKESSGVSKAQPNLVTVPHTSYVVSVRPNSPIDSKANILQNIKRDVSDEMDYEEEEEGEEEGMDEDYDEEDAALCADKKMDVKPCLKDLQQRLVTRDNNVNPAASMTKNSHTTPVTCSNSLVSIAVTGCVVTTTSVLLNTNISAPSLSPSISSSSAPTSSVSSLTSTTSTSAQPLTLPTTTTTVSSSVKSVVTSVTSAVSSTLSSTTTSSPSLTTTSSLSFPSSSLSSSVNTKANDRQGQGMKITLGTSNSLMQLINIKTELSWHEGDEEEDYEEEEEEEDDSFEFPHDSENNSEVLVKPSVEELNKLRLQMQTTSKLVNPSSASSVIPTHTSTHSSSLALLSSSTSPSSHPMPFPSPKALQVVVPNVRDVDQISNLIGSISPDKAHPPVKSSVVGGLIQSLAQFRDRIKEKSQSSSSLLSPQKSPPKVSFMANEKNSGSSSSPQISATSVNEKKGSSTPQQLSPPVTNESSVLSSSQKMSAPGINENDASSSSQKLSTPETNENSGSPTSQMPVSVSKENSGLATSQVSVSVSKEDSGSQQMSVPETNASSGPSSSQQASGSRKMESSESALTLTCSSSATSSTNHPPATVHSKGKENINQTAPEKLTTTTTELTLSPHNDKGSVAAMSTSSTPVDPVPTKSINTSASQLTTQSHSCSSSPLPISKDASQAESESESLTSENHQSVLVKPVLESNKAADSHKEPSVCTSLTVVPVPIDKKQESASQIEPSVQAGDCAEPMEQHSGVENSCQQDQQQQHQQTPSNNAATSDDTTSDKNEIMDSENCSNHSGQSSDETDRLFIDMDMSASETVLTVANSNKEPLGSEIVVNSTRNSGKKCLDSGDEVNSGHDPRPNGESEKGQAGDTESGPHTSGVDLTDKSVKQNTIVEGDSEEVGVGDVIKEKSISPSPDCAGEVEPPLVVAKDSVVSDGVCRRTPPCEDRSKDSTSIVVVGASITDGHSGGGGEVKDSASNVIISATNDGNSCNEEKDSASEAISLATKDGNSGGEGKDSASTTVISSATNDANSCNEEKDSASNVISSATNDGNSSNEKKNSPESDMGSISNDGNSCNEEKDSPDNDDAVGSNHGISSDEKKNSANDVVGLATKDGNSSNEMEDSDVDCALVIKDGKSHNDVKDSTCTKIDDGKSRSDIKDSTSNVIIDNDDDDSQKPDKGKDVGDVGAQKNVENVSIVLSRVGVGDVDECVDAGDRREEPMEVGGCAIVETGVESMEVEIEGVASETSGQHVQKDGDDVVGNPMDVVGGGKNESDGNGGENKSVESSGENKSVESSGEKKSVEVSGNSGENMSVESSENGREKKSVEVSGENKSVEVSGNSGENMSVESSGENKLVESSGENKVVELSGNDGENKSVESSGENKSVELSGNDGENKSVESSGENKVVELSGNDGENKSVESSGENKSVELSGNDGENKSVESSGENKSVELSGNDGENKSVESSGGGSGVLVPGSSGVGKDAIAGGDGALVEPCEFSEIGKDEGPEVVDLVSGDLDGDSDIEIIEDNDDGGSGGFKVVGISTPIVSANSNYKRGIGGDQNNKVKGIRNVPLTSLSALLSSCTSTVVTSRDKVVVVVGDGDVGGMSRGVSVTSGGSVRRLPDKSSVDMGNVVEILDDDDDDDMDNTNTSTTTINTAANTTGSGANNTDSLFGKKSSLNAATTKDKSSNLSVNQIDAVTASESRRLSDKDLATMLHVNTNDVVEVIDDDDDDDDVNSVSANTTINSTRIAQNMNDLSSPKKSLSPNKKFNATNATTTTTTTNNSVVEILSSDEEVEKMDTGNNITTRKEASAPSTATTDPVPSSRLSRIFSGTSDDGVSSRSSHSPLSSPSGSGGVISRCIQTLGTWSKNEVAQWLARNKLDKICLNLTNLDGPGLQRMAFEYNRSPEGFYVRVKKSLGLTLFQTLVIERSLKSLINSMVSDS